MAEGAKTSHTEICAALERASADFRLPEDTRVLRWRRRPWRRPTRGFAMPVYVCYIDCRRLGSTDPAKSKATASVTINPQEFREAAPESLRELVHLRLNLAVKALEDLIRGEGIAHARE